MARIKLGTTITGIRGHIGGIIFSANQSGPFARLRPSVVTRHTSAVSQQRVFLSTLAIRWRSISAAQRSGWNTYAADSTNEKTNSLGEAYYISGFNWYCAINQIRLNLGLAILDTAPATGVPAAPSFTLAYFWYSPGADLDVTWTSGEFSGLYGRIYATLAPYGGSSSPPITSYTWIANIPYGGAAGYIIVPDLEDVFGTVNASDTLYVRVAAVNSDGRMGPFSYSDIQAT